MCAGDLAIEPRGEDGQPGPVNLDNAFNGQHGENPFPRQERGRELMVLFSGESLQGLFEGEGLSGR